MNVGRNVTDPFEGVAIVDRDRGNPHPRSGLQYSDSEYNAPSPEKVLSDKPLVKFALAISHRGATFCFF